MSSTLDMTAMLPTLPGEPEPSQVRRARGEEAAKQFEALLVGMMVKEMRKTVPEGMFGGAGVEMFAGLLDQELSARIAEQGEGFGLRELVARTLEVAPPTAARARGAGVAIQHAVGSMVEGARLTSGFGMRRHPVTGEHRHHDGIDLAAEHGAPIHAVRGGVVTMAREAGGYGLVVEIDHGDGTRARYAHCAALDVKEGERVAAGAPIAAVGATGTATGAHVHFEWREGGRAVDPREVLR